MNIALTLVGVVFIWVQMPASIESQKMQLANTPNSQAITPTVENAMMIGAFVGAGVTSLIRLVLVGCVFVAIGKFKAWLATH